MTPSTRKPATGSAQNRKGGPGIISRFKAWVFNHLYALFSSLGRLYQQPLNALMTIGVIGIAISLPIGLYVALSNIQGISSSWQDLGEIALFLNDDTQLSEAEALRTSLKDNPSILSISLLNKEQALEDYKQNSGFSNAIDALDENPLPHVLIVQLIEGQTSSTLSIVNNLEAHERVNFAQYDLQWLLRFKALLTIAQRIIQVISGLFALSVFLIVGNTIRLDIENRRAEIEIAKLVGASNGFIRQPFLYSGLWYGLLGGLTALLLIEIALILLDNPIKHLSIAYSSTYSLSNLNIIEILILLGLSTVNGLVGAWLSVGRHIAAIEPGKK